jgi:hypothetical protein
MARLLLGLYNYRFKHLAILEEINTATTPKFHFSYNNYFDDQDDDFTKVYPYLNPREHAPRYVYMLRQKLKSIPVEINFFIYENVILPKGSTLLLLKYIHEDDGITKYGDEVNNKKQSDQGSLVGIKHSGGFRLDDRPDQLRNQESPI